MAAGTTAVGRSCSSQAKAWAATSASSGWRSRCASAGLDAVRAARRRRRRGRRPAAPRWPRGPCCGPCRRRRAGGSRSGRRGSRSPRRPRGRVGRARRRRPRSRGRAWLWASTLSSASGRKRRVVVGGDHRADRHASSGEAVARARKPGMRSCTAPCQSISPLTLPARLLDGLGADAEARDAQRAVRVAHRARQREDAEPVAGLPGRREGALGDVTAQLAPGVGDRRDGLGRAAPRAPSASASARRSTAASPSCARLRWLQVCEPNVMPPARISARPGPTTGAPAASHGRVPGLGQLREHALVALEEAGGQEERGGHAARRQQRQRVRVVVGVAVVEGDRDLRAGAAPRLATSSPSETTSACRSSQARWASNSSGESDR